MLTLFSLAEGLSPCQHLGDSFLHGFLGDHLIGSFFPEQSDDGGNLSARPPGVLLGESLEVVLVEGDVLAVGDFSFSLFFDALGFGHGDVDGGGADRFAVDIDLDFLHFEGEKALGGAVFPGVGHGGGEGGEVVESEVPFGQFQDKSVLFPFG